MNLRLLLASAALLACGACAAHYADDDFVTAAAKLRPAVVLLTMDVPGDRKGDGPDSEYASGSVVASGAWGSDVLTVEHAIEGAWNLRVTVDDKRKFPARIIAKDADLDIALVRTSKPNLPVVHFGNSADALPGRLVGLVGYPIPDQFDDEGLGLATSLASGRISSFRPYAIEVTLQIVPGESGSPVFLGDTGEVVGMAESRFEDERSIGFALPAENAKSFLHKYDAAHGL